MKIKERFKKIIKGIKRNPNIISMCFLILTTFIAFVTVEVLAETNIMNMSYEFGILNLVCYIIVFLIIFCILKSTRYTMIIGEVLFYIIGVANYFVLQFRSCPILPCDIYSLGTAASVAGNFKYQIKPPLIIGTIIMILVVISAFILKNYKIKNTIKLNLSMVITCMLVIGIWFFSYYKTDLLENNYVKVDAWIQKNGYARCGFALSFAANSKYLMVEKPEGYSVEELQDNLKATLQKEESITNDKESNKTSKNGKENEIVAMSTKEQPNIIAIMNESFSDLKEVGEFETNKDYMPFIRNLKEDTVKGKLQVSVKAGGTCNTEFEFLTGNSLAFLPQGSIAYQQYVKTPYDNLTTILSDQGYDNVAIHPYYSTGWNRNVVYPLLGFKQFLSLKDFVEPQIRRKYVSDKASFERVKSEFEQRKDDGPVFLFNVTMQNHGGYGGGDNGFISDIKVKGMEEYVATNEYLSIIRYTDEAVKDLIKYLKKEKEPTLVVFFGDHQPGVEESFFEKISGKPMSELSLEELQNRYTVPFFIWANYDIKEKDMGTISPNYLSSLLLDTAELEMPEYNQFLLKVMEEVPSLNANGYIGKDGKNYKLDEETAYSEILKEYNCLQYNNMFDHKNKVKSIFSLKAEAEK